MEYQSLTVTVPPSAASEAHAECRRLEHRRNNTDGCCPTQGLQAHVIDADASIRLATVADSQPDSGTAVHRLSTDAGACKSVLLVDSSGECESCSHGVGSLQADKGAAAYHARAQEWFLRCGMPKAAWNGWCTMHINPQVAIAHYYASEIGMHALSIYMVTGMHVDNSVNFWLVTFPLIMYILVNLVTDVGFWRCGPDFVNVNIYPLLLLLPSVCIFPLLYVGYLGPISAVPWNNRVLFMCVNVGATWMSAQGLVAGRVKGNHPAEPRTSIVKPVLQCTVTTILFWDALTDLSVFKSLLEQKSNGCWWFGDAGRCDAWTWLIAVYGCFAVLDLVCVWCIIMSGSDNSDGIKRRAKQRLNLALQIVCTLCEVGLVCGTLLHLFSLRSTREVIGSIVGDTNIGTEMALSFVSLFSALIGLTLMLVGTSKTYRAFVSTCDKVCQAITVRSRGSRPNSITSDSLNLKSGSVLPECT